MTNYDYEYSGASSGIEFLAAFFMVMAGFFFFAIVAYVVTAFFLQKLLKSAGHKTPASAWVPLWSTVSLMEIGGIKQPWIWTLIFFGGSAFSNLIPGIGPIISLAVLVFAVIVTIFLAKGVQAGVGKGETGMIVLAVLVPMLWIILMAIESEKRKYDRERALAVGATMPFNWFGDGDPRAAFAPDNYAAANANNFPQTGNPNPSFSTPPSNPYHAPAAHQGSTQQGFAVPPGYNIPEGYSTTESSGQLNPYENDSYDDVPEGYDGETVAKYPQSYISPTEEVFDQELEDEAKAPEIEADGELLEADGSESQGKVTQLGKDTDASLDPWLAEEKEASDSDDAGIDSEVSVTDVKSVDAPGEEKP